MFSCIIKFFLCHSNTQDDDDDVRPLEKKGNTLLILNDALICLILLYLSI